jgi:hypothetical protein
MQPAALQVLRRIMQRTSPTGAAYLPPAAAPPPPRPARDEIATTEAPLVSRPRREPSSRRTDRVVPCDIDHAYAALRLAQETMALETWSERALELLRRELDERQAVALVAGIRERLLTTDADHQWLVEDRWLRGVHEETRPEARALIAARWYAEQEPVVRAAEKVREMRERLGHGWIEPHMLATNLLHPDDLDGFFKPPLSPREQGAQRRALAHALHDLGLVEPPGRQHDADLRIEPRAEMPVAAFGWALRYDLRQHHRVEASQRWVERESLPARLFALSPSLIANSIVPRLGSWVMLSYLAGQPRVTTFGVEQEDGAPEPSSASAAARMFAAADQAERQRFDPHELEDVVGAFRQGLAPYFADRRDPTPVLRTVRDQFPHPDGWPSGIDRRTEAIRRVADTMVRVGEIDERENGTFLGLGPAFGHVFIVAGSGLARALDALYGTLSYAVRNLPLEDLARMVARLVEDLAARETTIDPSDVEIWIREHALEVHAASPPLQRLALPNDAFPRILRLAARAPIGNYIHRGAGLALQRLIVKAAPDRAAKAAGHAGDLIRRRGFAVEGYKLLAEIEGHPELLELPPPSEMEPGSGPGSRMRRFELLRDVATNGGGASLVAFVNAWSKSAARAAFERARLPASPLRSIVDAGPARTSHAEGDVVLGPEE